MLTTVSCLFFYFVDLTVLKKNLPDDYIKHEKEELKKFNTHTLKLTKHWEYLLCNMFFKKYGKNQDQFYQFVFK